MRHSLAWSWGTFNCMPVNLACQAESSSKESLRYKEKLASYWHADRCCTRSSRHFRSYAGNVRLSNSLDVKIHFLRLTYFGLGSSHSKLRRRTCKVRKAQETVWSLSSDHLDIARLNGLSQSVSQGQDASSCVKILDIALLAGTCRGSAKPTWRRLLDPCFRSTVSWTVAARCPKGRVMSCKLYCKSW